MVPTYIIGSHRSCATMQAADVECASWLADAQVPFSLVFTKTDKRKKGVPGPQQNIEAFQVGLITSLSCDNTSDSLSC